ncbi:MAG TPA: ATP-dependent DNA helicase RecG, partial [Methylovirgula sp.]
MRPSLLDPLFALAASLPGIGPKTGKLLDRLLVETGGAARLVDLLFHLPVATIDRRDRPKIADAPLDQIIIIEAQVVAHHPPPPRSKAPYKVLVEDETG